MASRVIKKQHEKKKVLRKKKEEGVGPKKYWVARCNCGYKVAFRSPEEAEKGIREHLGRFPENVRDTHVWEILEAVECANCGMPAILDIEKQKYVCKCGWSLDLGDENKESINEVKKGLQAKDKGREQLFLDPEDLILDRYQPRSDLSSESIEEMKNSISLVGQLEPIQVVRVPEENKYAVVVGHRRALAAKALGISVWAIVLDEPPEELWTSAIISNIVREDMSPVDQAKSLLKLKEEKGLTDAQIAEAIGKSKAYVSRLLKIVKLPQEVLDLNLSKSLLFELVDRLGKMSAEAMVLAAKEAAEQGYSRDHFRQRIEWTWKDYGRCPVCNSVASLSSEDPLGEHDSVCLDCFFERRKIAGNSEVHGIWFEPNYDAIVIDASFYSSERKKRVRELFQFSTDEEGYKKAIEFLEEIGAYDAEVLVLLDQVYSEFKTQFNAEAKQRNSTGPWKNEDIDEESTRKEEKADLKEKNDGGENKDLEAWEKKCVSVDWDPETYSYVFKFVFWKYEYVVRYCPASQNKSILSEIMKTRSEYPYPSSIILDVTRWKAKVLAAGRKGWVLLNKDEMKSWYEEARKKKEEFGSVLHECPSSVVVLRNSEPREIWVYSIGYEPEKTTYVSFEVVEER